MKCSFFIFYTTLLFLLGNHFAVEAQKMTVNQANKFLEEKPTFFEENKGQIQNHNNHAAPNVRYHYQKGALQLFMLPKGIAYQFSKVHYPKGYQQNSKNLTPTERKEQERLRDQIRLETYRMDMELVGANPNATIMTEGKSQDYINYYNKEALKVHSFQKLIYQDIYPGIDWVVYSTEQGLKYDFIVHAGADPNQIQIHFKDHETIKMNENGSFTISNRMGSITEQAPVSFQGTHEISTQFQLSDHTISFKLANYDTNKDLIIDPSLIWATYYGGNNYEFGYSCTVDLSGNVFLAGNTYSTTNIASGGHQNTFGGDTDAFLVKFNSNGVRQWATYYGGSDFDGGYDCVSDGSGNIFLTGITESSNNIASGGHQNVYGGGTLDAFLVKFNSSGVRQWATYYGGNNSDEGTSIAIDGQDNVFLCGTTGSLNNIATVGGHQNNFGGNVDAFLVKFNSSGVRQWATYYGGNDDELGLGTAIDTQGNVFLSGITRSLNNIVSNAHQATHGGGVDDVFLVKLNNNGVRQWGTYYGGNSSDREGRIAVDIQGNVFLGGSTRSLNNIVFNGHQNIHGSWTDYDAFLVKFNNNGVRQWGTYYGGSSRDKLENVSVDREGNVFLVGYTGSTTNIASVGHQNVYGGGTFDAFLVKFDSSGARQWGTYYGGISRDEGVACAADSAGNIYLAGWTQSITDIALGGHQNVHGGGVYDGFLAKFRGRICSNTSSTISASACDTYTWINGMTYTSSTTATDTLVNAMGCDSIITLNLTINNATTSMVSATACGAYTWINGVTYTSSTTATDTLVNAIGCDSIITLNLTINNATTSTVSATTCGAYTWTNGMTYTSSTTAMDTLVNAMGCDSIVTLNLTINNATTSTVSATTCGAYTWTNGMTYTSSTTAMDTLVNAMGCDSIVTLNLTINNATTSMVSATACGSYTWTNGVTYTSSTTAMDTLVNAMGCDSIVTLNLTINNATTSTVSATACGAYTWTNGVTYTSSTTATDTLVNGMGCDSIITLNLTIDTVNAQINLTGNTLMANHISGAIYQWLDCNTNTLIIGANNQSYTPPANGNYAVIITSNNCIDTSNCMNVIISGVKDTKQLFEAIKYYPIPTKDLLMIELSEYINLLNVSVLDVSGKVVLDQNYTATKKITLPVQFLPAGIYFVAVVSGKERTVIKMIKE
ncbi:DUF7948 domain-containing protein [Aureispira anguillae]|uniref:SBBP repeat-containing protein n=1 Tax=Aureispira anguillae TaxID=2864201 RepID=A0A915YEC5_9BACT|nr:SBBP repeat-containing protein [Aureispira anguillae]BDS11570.1 SBBP repeat-containing protein [Aureispira anguillae]